MEFIYERIEKALEPNLITPPLNQATNEYTGIFELTFKSNINLSYNADDLNFNLILGSIMNAIESISKSCGDSWDFFYPELICMPSGNSFFASHLNIVARFYCREKKGAVDVH